MINFHMINICSISFEKARVLPEKSGKKRKDEKIPRGAILESTLSVFL